MVTDVASVCAPSPDPPNLPLMVQLAFESSEGRLARLADSQTPLVPSQLTLRVRPRETLEGGAGVAAGPGHESW